MNTQQAADVARVRVDQAVAQVMALREEQEPATPQATPTWNTPTAQQSAQHQR
jgi:hypothetical protein